MSIEAMKRIYEAVFVLGVLFGSETWVMSAGIISCVEAVEMW